MIRVEGLTKRFGDVTVLDDVSFTVPEGEAVALWGPNGAGKTTAVRCILGFLGYEGEIEVNGIDARRRPKAVRHIVGHVPQELVFYDDLTISETLDLSRRLRGVDESRTGEMLELVDLDAHRTKKVRELSGGMKQKLGIALALLGDPPALLLDEPTSSLDVASREHMIEVLEALETEGRSIILTTHDLDEVGMLVDRVLAMEDGKVIEECAPSELAERLGLRSWLHLIVGPGQQEAAVELLTTRGFRAHTNSSGILVEVSAQRKGKALHTLQESGFEIVDLEVWR